MKTNTGRKKKKTITAVDAKALRQIRAFGIERGPGIGETGHGEICGGEVGGAWLCRRRSETTGLLEDGRMGRPQIWDSSQEKQAGKEKPDCKASKIRQRDLLGFLL